MEAPGHFNVAAVYDRRVFPQKHAAFTERAPNQCPIPAQFVLEKWKRRLENVARWMLMQATMSYLESTDEKTASPLQPNGGENNQENNRADADRHISLTLAHELNNLLTVVQGHADRLFVKHQEDAILAPALKKISEAAHRAAELVRSAPKPDLNPPTA